MSSPPINHRLFVERLVIAVAVIGLALLLWNLRGLLLLVFGSVLVAVVLNSIARPIRERTRMPAALALLSAVALVAGLLVAAFWLFGSEVIRQGQSLGDMFPKAWEATLAKLDSWGLGDPVREYSRTFGQGGSVLSNLGAVAMSVGNALADTLLVLVGGIYLAAQPELYWAGIIKLVPERGRGLAADALQASGRALRLWLLGRLVSMVSVGLMTWLGLTLIGVPSALTLGVLAALLEFVPFIGPIASAIPAVILAFAAGADKAIYTILLFLVIQQIEGNILEPMVQQRAVDLPPTLLLFALVAGGFLFGMAGIILAAPLTVVLYVLVKRLYVREALQTQTRLPGED